MSSTSWGPGPASLRDLGVQRKVQVTPHPQEPSGHPVGRGLRPQVPCPLPIPQSLPHQAGSHPSLTAPNATHSSAHPAPRLKHRLPSLKASWPLG